ncbi:MAG: phage recombination protein Bet [Nitrosopumilales archaeon]|nr:MAG: phage recombination protein Bet [Nitrosopumilales archaeon]RPJ31565.1 MAG: phage recombination protein Bet [Nitrosopumilales archaeon]
MKNNEIISYEADSGQVITLSPDIVRNSISTDPCVTDGEIAMFLKLCESMKVNPFLREIYLVKYQNKNGKNAKANFIAGKELFTKRAESHPEYAGMKAGIVTSDNNGVITEREGTIVLPNETLIGGWAEVYRKEYVTPIKNTVSLSEYNAKQGLWFSKPATMIRKVALVQSLREAFPNSLGGLYTHEEMPVDGTKLPDDPIIVKEIEDLKARLLSPTEKKVMFSISGGDKNLCVSIAKLFGYDSPADIKFKDFKAICDALDDKTRRQNTIKMLVEEKELEQEAIRETEADAEAITNLIFRKGNEEDEEINDILSKTLHKDLKDLRKDYSDRGE